MEKLIGSEAKLKLEGVNGKLKISLEYDGKLVDGGAFLVTDSDLLIDELGKLIPGDSVLEQGAIAALKMGVKAALGGL